MENEKFKLITRRYLAWGLGGVAVATIAFIGVWGAIHNQAELVTLAGGGLIAIISGLVGFYFGKKTSEE